MSKKQELLVQWLEPSWYTLANSVYLNSFVDASWGQGRLIHRRATHTDWEVKPPGKCVRRLQCVLESRVWEKKDNANENTCGGVSIVFIMVNFRVRRPGLQWLLRFLVLWPWATCLTPVSYRMQDTSVWCHQHQHHQGQEQLLPQEPQGLLSTCPGTVKGLSWGFKGQTCPAWCLNRFLRPWT